MGKPKQGIAGKKRNLTSVENGDDPILTIHFTHEEIGRVAWEAYRDKYYESDKAALLSGISLEELPDRAQVAWQESAAAVALHMFNLFMQDYRKSIGEELVEAGGVTDKNPG